MNMDEFKPTEINSGASVEDLNPKELSELIKRAIIAIERFNEKKKPNSDDGDKDFVQPGNKKTKRKHSIEHTPNFESHNVYNALLNDELPPDDDVHMEPTEPEENNTHSEKVNGKNDPIKADRPPKTTTVPENNTQLTHTPGNAVDHTQPKIAPIYLKNKEKWQEATNLLKMNGIIPQKSKLVTTGIKIEPASENDYRKIKKLLEQANYEFYTYQLRSEKTLKVVVRGLMQELSEEEIKNDLLSKGYPTIKIIRMNGRDRKPAPLVIVELDKIYKSIHDLETCCDLVVTVESLRPRGDIIQCHKCQMFGHSQKNCNIAFKCMKCGGGHSTHECPKSKTTPPKCANCAGEHLSIWLGCPMNPNNPENAPKLVPAPKPTSNPWLKRREDKDVAKPTQRNTEERKPEERKTEEKKTEKNDQDQLALVLGKMLVEFNKTNANTEQQLNFLKYTKDVISLFSSK